MSVKGERKIKRRVHRNLLFPLSCSNLLGDHKDQQQNVNDEDENSHSSSSVDSGVNHQDDDNMSYWSTEEDKAPYSGPVMRSRDKTQMITALSKASNFIASYFNAEVDTYLSNDRSYWFIMKNVAHAIDGIASKLFK